MQENKVQYKPHDEWNVNKTGFFGKGAENVEYAGFWLRVIASFIDGFVLMFAFSLLFGLFALLIAVLVPTLFATLGDKLQNYQPNQDQMGQIVLAFVAVIYGVNFIANWLYFALFEASSYQATPGKIALDLKVTDMDGKQISFIRASIRFWAKIPSSIIFCIGLMMAGWTEKKQCLHDMLTNCLVIKE